LVVPEKVLRPGFFDLHYTIEATGRERDDGFATFGYCVDEIPPARSMPEDFERFWAGAVELLDDVPFNTAEQFVGDMRDGEISRYNEEHASIPGTLDPDGCRHDQVRVHKLQFSSAGGREARRYHAWLAMPAGAGPFPGLLVLPGAGCTQVPMPVEHARHGYAALMLQVHGMDVDQDAYTTPEHYMKGAFGPSVSDDYWFEMILACVQAARVLGAHPRVDAGHVSVCGGSQGGFLGMAVAALCPEIRAVASSICFHADWPFRHCVETANAARSDGQGVAFHTFDVSDDRQRHAAYYDAMNFAALVKAPTIMSVCLCDHASPVTTVYEAYRHLAAPQKELHWSVGTRHDFMVAFERAAWRWVERKG
jgi:cephalosporin-C deacetylase-like acetyl esterase